MPDTILIIGAGHAGGCAAAALRAAGFAGPVTLIGSELHPPYERPPLSKELLAGRMAVEATYLRPAAAYAEAGIALRLGATVLEIDPAAQRVRLDDGTALPYDALLIATGARARRLAIPGAAGPRVFHLRDIADTLALQPVLQPGRHLIVLGAGFVGLETAAIARELGCAVTVIELADRPLARVAPPELGRWFEALHRRHGVAFRFGEAATAIRPAGEGVAVETSAGETLAGDAVLVAVGAVPNTELAAAAGLAVEDGILVDELGRSSAPRIYAAGDATRHFNPLLGRAIRLESWQNAQNQAIAVARVMAGGDRPHAELPWFWSDQYGVNLQTAGAPLRWDRLVWRGAPEDGRFTLFQLDQGVPVGGATIDNARDMRWVRLLVTQARPVDPAALADPGVKLAALLAP